MTVIKINRRSFMLYDNIILRLDATVIKVVNLNKEIVAYSTKEKTAITQ